jgi:hypothetical protein
LFAFLVLGHGRRELLWIEVTRHPTAEWLARQITEAFPWTSAPAYLVRDNDGAYGHVFTSRVRARRTDCGNPAFLPGQGCCGSAVRSRYRPLDRPHRAPRSGGAAPRLPYF